MQGINRPILPPPIETEDILRSSSTRHIRKKSPKSPMFMKAKHQAFNSNRQISPFEKITSKKAICKNTLPGFLLTNQQIEDFRKTKNPISKIVSPCSVFTQKVDTPMYVYNHGILPSSHTHQKTPQGSASKLEVIEQIKTLVFNSDKSPEQIILRIGKLDLTITDLSSLEKEQPLTNNIMNAGLKYIKKRNKIRINFKKEPLERVYIVNTQLCEKIFGETPCEEKLITKDLLKYDDILFPVFVGYWTLLVCSLGRKTIFYYDPIGIESSDKLMKNRLFSFLKQEIQLDESAIQSMFIRKLTYKNVTESEVYDHVDSGIYVLRQAFRLSLDRRAHVKPEYMNDFRYKLLYYLFKHGTKINI